MAEVVLIMHDETLYAEGHLVRRWFEGLGKELEVAIKDSAPHSGQPGGTKKYPPRQNKTVGAPGDLKRGIEYTGTSRPTPRSLEAEVHSSAPHTFYVLYGTSGHTSRVPAGSPEGGQYSFATMKLPAQSWIKRKRLQSVAGQEPNNFFQRGYDKVASVHSSLR